MKILDLSGCSIKADAEIVQGNRGSGDGELALLQAEQALMGADDFDIIAVGPDACAFDDAVVAFAGCRAKIVSKGPDGWTVELPKKSKPAKKKTSKTGKS